MHPTHTLARTGLLALVALAACGGTETAQTTSGAVPAPEVLTPARAAVDPLTTPAGGEDTVCIYRRLDNEEAGYVRSMRGQLSHGSHHMIVYASKETEEQLTPFRCDGFGGIVELDGGGLPGIDSKDIPIFIGQQPDVEVLMPSEGGVPVAFPIEAHQMLRIELHWFNTTSGEQDVTGTFDVGTVPMGTKVIESSFAFWGTTAIDIPPKSAGDTGKLFQRGLSDTKVFAVTTHQHKLGTRMRVWESTGTPGDADRLLTTGEDWADPPLTFLDPPAAFDGASGLTYQCEWQNTTDNPVGFGEDFDDEMCFLWTYYYPSRGFDICVHFDEGSPQGVCNHLVR